jgi:hypothetical protein
MNTSIPTLKPIANKKALTTRKTVRTVVKECYDLNNAIKRSVSIQDQSLTLISYSKSGIYTPYRVNPVPRYRLEAYSEVLLYGRVVAQVHSCTDLSQGIYSTLSGDRTYVR